MPARYEVLSHTADTGVVARGETLSEAFENAAFAMFDLIFGIGDLVGEEQFGVVVVASPIEELLVDWLGTLLFEAETRDLALCSFEIDVLDESRLSGRVGGVASNKCELLGPPIKAVTYHDLSVDRTARGWSVRVVFDV